MTMKIMPVYNRLLVILELSDLKIDYFVTQKTWSPSKVVSNRPNWYKSIGLLVIGTTFKAKIANIIYNL